MAEISIILPVYNKENYINNILRDIMQQEFKDFECIIIDDGSSDESGEICDRVAVEDNRFKVVHIQNGGVSHARNMGMDLATGKYITFMDADDEVLRNYLSELYECIEKNKTDMVISGIEKYWPDTGKSKKIKLPIGKKSILEIMDNFSIIQKQTGVFGFCWGKLISRKIIEGIYFDEDLKLAEDFEFYLKVYPQVDTIYFDNKCKYIYTQEADNSWSKLSDDEIDYYSQLKINLRYKNFLKGMGFYHGENKNIVNENLNNYIFFIILHSKREKICERVQMLNKDIKKYGIQLKGKDIFQKTILFLVKHKKGVIVKNIMIFYDKLRQIKNINNRGIA